MISLKFFFSLILIFIASISSEKSILKVSKVFSEVIEKLYVENSLKFDILFYGKKTRKLNLICDEFLKLNRKVFPSKIEHKSDLNSIIKLSNSTIILTSSQENFLIFLEKIELKNIFPIELKFLFYVEEKSELKIPKGIEKYFYENGHRGHFYQFVYFIQETKNEIKLFTIESFTEKLCNQSQIVTLNTFNRKIKKWKTNLEIPEKFSNFHNCTIVCGVYIKTQSCYINQITQNIEGIIPNVMKNVAPKLNFSLFLQTYELLGSNEVKLLNGFEYFPHVFISTISTIQQIFHLTTTFDEEGHFFVITPAEKFSSYEKRLLPFDTETWTYLMIVFGVAFGTVFIINLMPRNVQYLFYGKRITMPSYNIAGSFFGISQRRLPKENFPRILLIYFVIFCLIFRTAYQGVFFEMMTTDMRKKLPQTIHDLYKMNFTIIYNAELIFSTHELSNMIEESERPPLLGLYFAEYNKTFPTQIRNESAKLAFYTTTYSYLLFSKLMYRVEAIKLKEILYTSHIGLRFPRNHFLRKKSDEVIQRLSSAGIARKLWKEFHNFKPIPKDVKQPSVLTVEDLRFGFTIWLVACGVSFAVFMNEIIYFFVKEFVMEKVKKFIGLILFFKLLKWKVENY